VHANYNDFEGEITLSCLAWKRFGVVDRVITFKWLIYCRCAYIWAYLVYPTDVIQLLSTVGSQLAGSSSNIGVLLWASLAAGR